MTVFVFANNINTTLASAAAPTATTLTLASTVNLPTIPSGSVLPITLNDVATRQVFEVVYATAISGANLTVIRGQEGTAAQTWAVGAYVYSDDTAGVLSNFANINGSTTQNFTAATFLTGNGIEGTGGYLPLLNANYTASINDSESAYIQHYCATAVNASAAVTLGQGQSIFAALNGSSAQAFSASAVSTASVACSTGALLLLSNTATKSENLANSAYVEHYCLPATVSQAAVTLGQFPSSLTANGWKKYPDPNSPTGYFIEQWGYVTGTTQSVLAYNFPIAFPNACLEFGCQPGATIPLTTFLSCGGGIVSASQYDIALGSAISGQNYGVLWQAKGY